MKNTDATSEITTITRPAGTVLVNPRGIAFTYDRANDKDILSILVDDKRIGALQILFTPSGALAVIDHLTAMIDDLDALRAEWHRGNTQDGDQ